MAELKIPVSTERLLARIINKNEIFRKCKVHLSNQDINVDKKDPIAIIIKIDYASPKSSYIVENKNTKKPIYYSLVEESGRFTIVSFERDILIYPVLLQAHFREWILKPDFYELKTFWMFENWRNLSDLEESDRITRLEISFNVLREYQLQAKNENEKITGIDLNLNILR